MERTNLASCLDGCVTKTVNMSTYPTVNPFLYHYHLDN